MCWDRQVQPEAVRPGWVLPDEFLVGLDVEDKARSLTALVLGGEVERTGRIALPDTIRIPKDSRRWLVLHVSLKIPSGRTET